MSPDEQAIYEAVLNAWLGSRHGKQFVNQRLAPPPSASDPENAECAKGLSFLAIPEQPSKEKTLSGATFHRSDIELVDGETWTPTDPARSIGRGKSVSSAVDEGVSKSLISFSQVDFSVDRRDALVSFSMACGMLCGTGSTLRVHRSKGQWRIARRCGEYMN